MWPQHPLNNALFEKYRIPKIVSTDQAGLVTAAATFTDSVTVPIGCNLLVAVVTAGDNTVQTFIAPTYAGTAMTIAVDSGSSDPGTSAYCMIAYLFNPTTGSAQNLVVDWSASTNVSCCDIKSFCISGASASPINASNSATRAGGGSTDWAIDLKTTKPALILGGRCIYINSNTYTPGVRYTEAYDVQNGNVDGNGSHFAQYFYNTSIGHTTFDCTASSTGTAIDTDSMAAVAII